MLANPSLQLGAIFILIGMDSDNMIRDPLDNPQCGTLQKPSAVQTRMIVGGNEAMSGAWPWQIALLDSRKRLICGGTLISSEFVLTAAHCITQTRMYIVAGEYNLAEREGHEQERLVRKSIIHPRYDKISVDNDIALLKLDSPLELTQRIWPACLPEQNEELRPETMATILGWGAKSYDRQAGGKPRVERDDMLRQAAVPVVDFEECKLSYGENLESHHVICAGYREGRIDSCAGDSGGPLLIERDNKWLVYGVTSFGEDCGKEGKYGIYSKTSAYVSWIRKTVAKHRISRTSV